MDPTISLLSDFTLAMSGRRWNDAERWEYLTRLHGDSSLIPGKVAVEVWGEEVVWAEDPPKDCPDCSDTDFLVGEEGLCEYHYSRQCGICGGVKYCQGWCP